MMVKQRSRESFFSTLYQCPPAVLNAHSLIADIGNKSANRGSTSGEYVNWGSMGSKQFIDREAGR